MTFIHITITYFTHLGKVTVVCNQTGKALQVPVEKLSKENGEDLCAQDLLDGQNVLYEDSKGKTYDVTIRPSIGIINNNHNKFLFLE